MMYLAVFAGGALGSLLRELAVPHLPVIGPLSSTFAPNIVACVTLGWLYAVRHKVHAHAMHLGAVGFCGGLSTFSSFAAEVHALAAGGHLAGAALAPSFEIAAGIAAAAIGAGCGRRVHADPAEGRRRPVASGSRRGRTER